MNIRIVPKLGWLAILALVACVAAWAVDGRDFAGFFEPKDPVESGPDVILTFKTQVFNYCGEDVLGATVELKNVVHPEQAYATWTVVDIPAGRDVRLTLDITVPLEEYYAWHQGGMPWLTIEFQDAAGNDRQHTVELGPTIFAEEG